MTNPRRAITVELCITGLKGARAAAAGGADRIEVCAGLPLGGLTPSLGLVRQILETVDLPVIALIRPREGGFRYHIDEIVTQIADVAGLAAVVVPVHGTPRRVSGFAVGALTAEGDLDCKTLERLRATAPDLEWCLHRAFDHVRDPEAALEAAIDLGFDRILTSGQSPSAPEGIPRLAALVEQSAGRIELMPGGGITAENVATLLASTGVSSVHLSASRWVPGGMTFCREGLSLGSGAAPDEARHLETDGDRVAALFRALDAPHTATPGAGNEE